MLAVTATIAGSTPAHAALNPDIIITESGGNTNVHPDGPLTDSYTIALNQAPTGWVRFTLSTSYGGGTPFAQISVDGGTTWGVNGVVVFDAGETAAQTVLIRWADASKTPDDYPAGVRVMTIVHPADSWDDPHYDFTDGPNVYVGMEPAAIDPDPPIDPDLPTDPTRPAKIDTAAA